MNVKNLKKKIRKCNNWMEKGKLKVVLTCVWRIESLLSNQEAAKRDPISTI